MAINKQKKKEIIEQAEKALKKAESLVFVNFHGLKVGEITAMRKDLKSKGINYLVSKKTLLKRALEAIKPKGVLPELLGEVAVTYGDDSIAPARETYGFERKFKESFSILGGVFEGAYTNRARMLEIASIPPLKILYGQFVNLINSPIQGLVISLSQIEKRKQEN